MSVSKNAVNWIIFFALSTIWGSSFILMKLGMYDSNGKQVLTATQVAALRILSAGIVLIPFVFKSFRLIPRSQWGIVILSGLLGSFFPAFLFCIAETRIDSSIAGTLNSLTPTFVIISGMVMYGTSVSGRKMAGVLISLAGCFMLLLTKAPGATGNIFYAGFILIAALMYGINVNMVKQKLQNIGSLTIVSFAFTILTVPSALILWMTGYFELPLSEPIYMKSTAASAVLGIGGTAVASVLYYMLVKRAGALFGSLVTYGIPFVAIFWGLLYGEHITFLQVISLAVILTGVYIVTAPFTKQT